MELARKGPSCHTEDMSSPSDHDLQRLAALAHARRADLGIPLNDDTAKAAGVAKGTWQRVEKGMPIRVTNYVKIDDALKWAPGSCRRILDGGDPIIVAPSEADPDMRISEISAADLKRTVGDAVTRAAMITKGTLTADEILELNRRVLEELKERGVI